MHTFIHQSQFIEFISIWDTLYIPKTVTTEVASMRYKCFIARYNVYTVIIESLSFQECDYKIEMYSIVPNPYDYVHSMIRWNPFLKFAARTVNEVLGVG